MSKVTWSFAEIQILNLNLGRKECCQMSGQPYRISNKNVIGRGVGNRHGLLMFLARFLRSKILVFISKFLFNFDFSEF